jgi:hypothetical protein
MKESLSKQQERCEDADTDVDSDKMSEKHVRTSPAHKDATKCLSRSFTNSSAQPHLMDAFLLVQ